MMRWALLGALLGVLLAGCTTAPGSPPDQAGCESQANGAPAVKELAVKAAGSPEFARNHEEEIKAVRQDAVVACLRGRGVVRGGGVERLRP